MIIEARGTIMMYFQAKVVYTAFPYGEPGKPGSVLACDDDKPVLVESFTGAKGRTEKEAYKKVEANYKSQPYVIDVVSIELKQRL